MKRSKAGLFSGIPFTVLAIVLVVWVVGYVHPSPRDDYPNSVWDHFGEKVALLYRHSSGRYLHNLLLPLCPMHWHQVALYRLVIALLFLAFVASFLSFFCKLLQSYLQLSRDRARFVALISLLVFVNNMNSITEAFFWFTGGIAYILPAILMMILGCIIIRVIIRQQATPAASQYYISIFLVAGIIGCNEILMLGCDALCFLLFITASPRSRRYFGCLLAVAFVCSVIAVLAPGNFVRQNSYRGPAFSWAHQWAVFGVRTIAEWVANPYFLSYTLLLAAAFRSTGIVLSRKRLLFSLLLPFALIYVLSLPAFISLYFGPPPRVRNILFLCFQASWVNLMYCVVASLKLPLANLGLRGKTILSGGMAVMIVLSVKFGDLRAANFYKLVNGISTGAFRKGDVEVRRRYALIGASPLRDVAVPPLSYDRDNILMLDDIPDLPDPRCLTTGKLFNKNNIYLLHVK